jgi:hypothetical protein
VRSPKIQVSFFYGSEEPEIEATLGAGEYRGHSTNFDDRLGRH